MKIALNVFVCGLLMIAFFSNASGTGKVLKLEFGPAYGNIVHVNMDYDNPTECSTNGAGFDYSFDSSTEVGKKMFSALLAAQKAKTSIQISGTGHCTVNTNTEDIRWMQTLSGQ